MSNPAYDYAIKALARREHSEYELRQKLELKGFDLIQINQALDLLQQQNYQDDTRFAEALTRARKNQGKGSLLVINELKKHQIIDPEQYLYDIDFYDLCKTVRLKKFGEDKIKDYKQKNKQIRFLSSRGFSFDEINNSFK